MVQIASTAEFTASRLELEESLSPVWLHPITLALTSESQADVA